MHVIAAQLQKTTVKTQIKKYYHRIYNIIQTVTCELYIFKIYFILLLLATDFVIIRIIRKLKNYSKMTYAPYGRFGHF